MGEHDRIATTGFSRMSDRQMAIWDTGSLENIKTTTIDQSSGVIIPFWSDNNILFLGACLSLPNEPLLNFGHLSSWKRVSGMTLPVYIT